MELIIDANILFAALIRESHTRHIILSSGWIFYAPEFIFEEFKKHIGELIEKTNLSKEMLERLIEEFFITANIQIIPLSEFEQFLVEAESISPDPDDVPYFALALKFGCAIWSNDGKLKEQDKIKIFSTEDILNSLKKS